MAWRSIGILTALCALAVAVDLETKYPLKQDEYFHGVNNPNFPARIESTSDEDVPTRGHHVHKYHPSHSAENSEEGGHHGHHKPHISRRFEESQEIQDKWELTKPHHHGGHLPHFPHHHESHTPHIPHPLQYANGNIEGFARRRPIFLPYHPYHPFYPHTHSSPNEEEFETIEALRSRSSHGSHNPNFPLTSENQEELKNKYPFYHGHHNPHFPINLDSSEESSEENDEPFYLGPHFPHFKPFHKEPVDDESDSSESTEIEHFKIPNILLDLYEILHHGHGKPHHKDPVDEDKIDEEGSGEEEISPLSNVADFSLVKEDTEDIEEEQDDIDPIDVVPINTFRSFLDSRKSIPIECDALNTPRYSCYNCYNYLVCKPEGGKIKSCKDPYAPYCNNGICSNVPGPDCPNL